MLQTRLAVAGNACHSTREVIRSAKASTSRREAHAATSFTFRPPAVGRRESSAQRARISSSLFAAPAQVTSLRYSHAMWAPAAERRNGISVEKRRFASCWQQPLFITVIEPQQVRGGCYIAATAPRVARRVFVSTNDAFAFENKHDILLQCHCAVLPRGTVSAL